MLLSRATRLLSARLPLGRPAAAGGARAFAGREGSAQTTTGRGLTNPGVQSEQEINQTKERVYEGEARGSGTRRHCQPAAAGG